VEMLQGKKRHKKSRKRYILPIRGEAGLLPLSEKLC